MLTEQELDAPVELELTETDTFTLLNLPAVAVAMDGPEAAAVKSSNLAYDQVWVSSLGSATRPSLVSARIHTHIHAHTRMRMRT